MNETFSEKPCGFLEGVYCKKCNKKCKKSLDKPEMIR